MPFVSYLQNKITIISLTAIIPRLVLSVKAFPEKECIKTDKFSYKYDISKNQDVLLDKTKDLIYNVKSKSDRRYAKGEISPCISGLVPVYEAVFL